MIKSFDKEYIGIGYTMHFHNAFFTFWCNVPIVVVFLYSRKTPSYNECFL